MTLEDLEKAFLRSFTKISTAPLECLDSEAIYSYSDKKAFVERMESQFSKIREMSITNISVVNDKCLQCYPEGRAYSFYGDNNKFLNRYIFHQNGPQDFIIEECKNRPLPSGENELPF